MRRLDQAVGFGRAANERPATADSPGSTRILIILGALGLVAALAVGILLNTPDDPPAKPPTRADAAKPAPVDDVPPPAFRKLPVSPSDRPPVGGVGPNGIHVDYISMGTKYGRDGCEGESKTFSLSGGDRPSVCVRLLHPREKEEVVLLWEKENGATRRGKLIIPNAHAYRTRAYLVLRREYVGQWTVRVQSLDGTDLATYAFTVVK